MSLSRAFALVLALGAFGCAAQSELDDGDAASDAAADVAPETIAACASACLSLPENSSNFFFVAFGTNAPPSCAAGWRADPTVVVEARADPATCDCSCAGDLSTGQCSNPTLGVWYGPSCASTPSYEGWYASNTCGSWAYASTGPAIVASIPHTYTLTVCPTATTTTSPPMVNAAGVCAPTRAMGCPTGAECVPPVPPGLALCVESYDPNAPCPPAFPTRHPVGSSFTDTRGCSACVCDYGGDGCDLVSATFYADSACTKPVITVDGGCVEMDAATSFPAVEIDTAITGTACAVQTASESTGSVTLHDGVVVCCP